MTQALPYRTDGPSSTRLTKPLAAPGPDHVLDRILPWRSAPDERGSGPGDPGVSDPPAGTDDATGVELFDAEEAVGRYADQVGSHGLFPAERKAIDRYFADEGGRVLDVGCGVGRVADGLSGMGYDVTGIDTSERMVERARSLFPDLEFRVADAADTGLPAESFDYAVFSYFGLDYIHPERRRLAALRELHRVLAPGGVLVFSSHNTWYALPAALLARDYLRDLYLRPANRSRLFSRRKLQSVPLGELEVYLTNPIHQRRQLRATGFDPLAVLGKRAGPLRYFEVQPHYVARK